MAIIFSDCQLQVFDFEIINYDEMLHEWIRMKEEHKYPKEEPECPIEDIASEQCLDLFSEEMKKYFGNKVNKSLSF